MDIRREVVLFLKVALHDTNDAVRATAKEALFHLVRRRKSAPTGLFRPLVWRL